MGMCGGDDKFSMYFTRLGLAFDVLMFFLCFVLMADTCIICTYLRRLLGDVLLLFLIGACNGPKPNIFTKVKCRSISV